MKILAVLGSARRNGNTETLIKEALRGAGEGHDVTFRVLSELNIFGCQGCRGCRLKDSEGCIFHDAMQDLYCRHEGGRCDSAWLPHILR